ncbi:MAG: sodium:calcium antiporter [Crocinitomicaceae bacterium]|nr:sodium:calcium antiporter [Crocinitomicaceae bacterium]
MIIVLLIFTIGLIYHSRRQTKKKEREEDYELEDEKLPFWKSGVFLGLGLVGLYFGSQWFVNGAVVIADSVLAGKPDKDSIIGVTVVALGTSTPELVTSCVAAYRKQTDISVGNLIGSNIFNIFAVLGITSVITPIEVSDKVLNFDMYWVIAISILLFFTLVVGKKMGRNSGLILLSSYVAYISIIVLKIKGVF